MNNIQQKGFLRLIERNSHRTGRMIDEQPSRGNQATCRLQMYYCKVRIHSRVTVTEHTLEQSAAPGTVYIINTAIKRDQPP